MYSTNKTPNYSDEQSNKTDSTHHHKLIEGEEETWTEGTIHILWPSTETQEDDQKYIAWCREFAKGELVNPDELLPLNQNNYEDRFCKTCLQKAENSNSIDEPEFLEFVKSKIKGES